MAAINFSINGNNQGILRNLQQTQNAFKDTARAAEAEGMRIEDVFDRIKQAATMTFAGISAKEFVQKMVQVRGKFQQLEIAFTTMLQSEEKANDLMNQLVRTAAITPFDLKGVAEGAKQLLAYGTAAEEVNETITRLGDIAAGLSIPLGDLVYLYGTTMVQGRMFTQDLRQFQGRGIPIAEEIAKIMGVTKDAVAELVTAGEVTDQVFKKAIENMTSEGSKFGGLMEAQSKTITGQISNIEDALDMMFNDLGKQSEGVINDALSGVSYLVEHYEEVGKVILTVAASFGAYKAALFAVMAAQKIASVWGEVQAFLSLAKSITSAKDAMLLLNMAVKANPLGLLLSTVTALAASFYLFSSNEGKAAEMASKYGDRAISTMNRVKTLTTTLNGLTAGTSTHTKVMGELNDILEDYGIEAIKEGDSIDSVNQKREKAIELIKREGIERQRANNLEQGMAEYSQALSDAQKKLYENLTGANTVDLDLGLVGYISGNKELQENASAISTIIANVVEANISKIANKTGEEYQNGLNDIFATIQERMRAIGISEETIASEWLTNDLFNHQNLVQNYVEAIKDAEEAHGRYRDMVNKSADAERDAADGATTYAEKLNAIESSLQGPNDSVHQLYTNIKNLMSQYNENTIGFTIRIGGEVPKWMETMDIPQLQELAKRFSSLGAANPNGLMIGDKYWSRQELLQRGADYATAADQKQTKKEADERAAREAAKEEEKKKKQREQEARRRAQEAERLRKEKEKYDRLTAEQRLEYERTAKDLELSTTQAQIDAMEEGSRKTIAQINLDFEKQKVEIERGYEDLKQSKIDKARQLWEANPANKGKAFDVSSVNTEYTEAETANYEAQMKAAREARDRSMREQAEQERQYLYDYMKEYGSLQDQKLAISREYADKIAKEDNAVQKAALAKERDALIEELNFKQLQNEIDWESVFDDLSKQGTAALRELKEKLKEALSAKDIDPENAKVLAEKIREIESTINDRTDVWGAILPALRKRKELIQEAAEAEERVRSITKEVMQLSVQSNRDLATLQSNIRVRTGGKEVGVNDISKMTSSEYVKLLNLDPLSEAGKNAAAEFDRLILSTINLEKSQENLSGAQKHSKGIKDSLDDFKGLKGVFESVFDVKGMGFTGMLGMINQNAQSMAEFSDKIGLEGTDFGDAVHGFADGVGGFTNGIQSLVQGDVFGAINGALDGVAGFGKMGISLFAGNGNVDEMEAEIARLSDVNDNLAKSIDGLANRINQSDTTNKQSTEAYKKALEAEKEWEANQRKAIDARASEYSNSGHGFLGLGGSHSFNYYLNDRGSNWYGWSDFNRVLQQNGYSTRVHSAGDLWNLSPEMMQLLRDYAPKAWIELLNTDGESNPSDLINEYIDRAGKIDELTSALNEKLTGYSWDGFLGSYKSLLKDLTSDTEDFGDKIEEIISSALLESLVNDEFKDRIKNLYQYISDHADDGLDDTELNYIRSENERIANEMIARRQNLIDAGMIKPSDDEYKQEASSKGFQAMSQDTGEELNGRFTALQIAGESINAKMDLIINAMNTLQSASSGGFDIGRNLNEVRGLIYLINSNVDSINERMKKYYERWDSIFSSIEENTQKL